MSGLNKYIPRKRIDNRGLQRSRSRRTMQRFTLVFLLGCLLVLGMHFSGWVRWRQQEMALREYRSTQRLEELLEKRKYLVMLLSRLTAPERAARAARGQLEMILPERASIHYVRLPDPATEAEQ